MHMYTHTRKHIHMKSCSRRMMAGSRKSQMSCEWRVSRSLSASHPQNLYIHTYICIYICIWICILMVCMYIYIYIYMRIARVVQLECLASTEFIYARIHRHTQLARPSHASMHIYMYTHTHTRTHTHPHTHLYIYRALIACFSDTRTHTHTTSAAYSLTTCMSHPFPTMGWLRLGSFCTISSLL